MMAFFNYPSEHVGLSKAGEMDFKLEGPWNTAK